MSINFIIIIFIAKFIIVKNFLKKIFGRIILNLRKKILILIKKIVDLILDLTNNDR